MALKHIHNKIYSQNETMKQIINVTQAELDRLEQLQQQAFDNNFIVLANSDGISKWEQIFNIVADIDEDIEFRRQRILSRLSTIPPYTKFVLIKFLDTAVGTGNYRLAINFYREYNLFLRLADDYLPLENELRQYLRQTIPANMTLDLYRLWANWHDILTRYLTWRGVLGADTWEKFKDMTWGDLNNMFWRDVLNANTWGDIKQYAWED